MRLFYTNALDGPAVVLTPSSEVATLPAENVLDEFRERVWRTGNAAGTETLVIDLGAAFAVTSIILLAHTLLAGDSNIKLEANSADSWGAPPFTSGITWSADTIAAVFAAQTYRYWRLSFTKASASARDIGRIFLGSHYELEDQPDYDGFDETLEDAARKQKSLGGQTYTELVGQYRMLRTDFSRITTAMITNMVAYAEAVGQSVSHFVQVDTASPFDRIYYVKLARAFKRNVEAIDATPLWAVVLEYEEQL